MCHGFKDSKRTIKSQLGSLPTSFCAEVSSVLRWLALCSLASFAACSRDASVVAGNSTHKPAMQAVEQRGREVERSRERGRVCVHVCVCACACVHRNSGDAYVLSLPSSPHTHSLLSFFPSLPPPFHFQQYAAVNTQTLSRVVEVLLQGLGPLLLLCESVLGGCSFLSHFPEHV